MKKIPLPFSPADILLPDLKKISGETYAVIACDQFTSEPEYWERADALVGDAPSALRLVLPECYLDEREERLPLIHREMKRYREEGLLTLYPDALFYLERRDSVGGIRRGLIGKIDLETYGFLPEDTLPIRATEGTVLERIPPRVEIRRGAPLELPHAMLLIDDPEDTVMRLAAEKEDLVYDFPLMLEGGHVTAWQLGESAKAAVLSALEALIPDRKSPLFAAVGDGNHSLAAAKTAYLERKALLGEEAALRDPSRYALCELVNLHDEALAFEPIYRAVFGVEAARLLDDADAFFADKTSEGRHEFRVLTPDGETEVSYPALHTLPVGTLGRFLDEWIASHPEARIDYIHGEDSLAALSKEGAVGFLFRGMEKEDLFPSILKDGPLPRKTFSMGHAKDKRYYLEARAILPEEA